MKKISIFGFVVATGMFIVSCKESANDGEEVLSADTTGTEQTDLQTIIEEEATSPETVKKTDGDQTIYNERFDFQFTVPGHYTVTEKSNNGDGYFVSCGDEGVDIRVYGENISDNQVMAEMELNACESKITFQFKNGYPGLLCLQSGDRYYYYDTPKTRVTLYIHAPARWFERNAQLVETIAKSLSVGKGGF